MLPGVEAEDPARVAIVVAPQEDGGRCDRRHPSLAPERPDTGDELLAALFVLGTGLLGRPAGFEALIEEGDLPDEGRPRVLDRGAAA